MNNPYSNGWIGVDLDGTLAIYNDSIETIGEPVPAMLERVKTWLAEGWEVRIFTARAVDARQCEMIRYWLKKHELPELPITNKKDYGMVSLWDDRAVQVIHNQGLISIPPYNPKDYQTTTTERWQEQGVFPLQIRAALAQLSEP